MKKLILFLVIVLPHFNAFAQDFRYGVKGGVNFSDISGKDLDKDSHRYKLGWHLGAMVNIKPTDNTYFSVQPELIYSRKGYESYSLPFESTSQGTTITAQKGGLVYLNYLDLPVMLNFKTGIIIFEIGPQFSYLVDVRDKSYTRFRSSTGEETFSHAHFSKQGINKFDAGIATGFRLESSNGVALGLRFNQGFLKLQKSVTDIPVAPNGCNQYFQLFASYLIPEQ
jgi:hypothetical protein